MLSRFYDIFHRSMSMSICLLSIILSQSYPNKGFRDKASVPMKYWLAALVISMFTKHWCIYLAFLSCILSWQPERNRCWSNYYYAFQETQVVQLLIVFQIIIWDLLQNTEFHHYPIKFILWKYCNVTLLCAQVTLAYLYYYKSKYAHLYSIFCELISLGLIRILI